MQNHMHQQHILSDYCTKYEQNQHKICETITMIINQNVVQNPILVCVHQQPMESDHDTKYKENASIHHGGMCEWTEGYSDTQTGHSRYV